MDIMFIQWLVLVGIKMVLLKSKDTLKVGGVAPDFSLKGTDGETYMFSSFKAKCVLLVFMCNHCPYVKQKMKILVDLQESFSWEELQVVGINSNDASTHPDDSFENMQKAVEEYGLNFVYLYDETQDVAKAYGASCTPDPFLFTEGKLVFHGRIDDGLDLDQEITESTMEENIIAILSGQDIDEAFKPSVGCSIKWKK